MNNSDDYYRELAGILKKEDLPENIKCAIIDYLSGNENAFSQRHVTLETVFAKVSMLIKMILVNKSEEYKTKASPDFIFGESAADQKLKSILNPDRIIDFNRVVKEMIATGLLNSNRRFVKNVPKAHNRLLSGVCAVLVQKNYFKKYNNRNKALTESYIVKTLFGYFRAGIHINEYTRTEIKKLNITMANDRFEVLTNIEIERRQKMRD